MPCYITGSAEGDARLSAEESNTEATKVTALLCSLCEALEKARDTSPVPFHVDVPKAVDHWWAAHKKIDAKRQSEELAQNKQEQLKRKTLSKLTKEEKIALGLLSS